MNTKSRSIHLDTAKQRASAISALAEDFEVSPGLTLAAYRAILADAQAKLDAYNNLPAQLITARAEFDTAETLLRDWSEHMLRGVGVLHGRHSDSCEAAGGTRKGGAIRRLTTRPAAPAAPAASTTPPRPERVPRQAFTPPCPNPARMATAAGFLFGQIPPPAQRPVAPSPRLRKKPLTSYHYLVLHRNIN